MIFPIHTSKGWYKGVANLANERRVLAITLQFLHFLLWTSWTSESITEAEAVASQPRPAPGSQVYMFFPIHTSKGWCKWVANLPNERKVLAITLQFLQFLLWTSGSITEPEAVASQPRPAPGSQVYMFFPIHTSKGWCKWVANLPNERKVQAITLQFLHVLLWTSESIVEAEAVASQPRPAPVSQVYMFFPIHTSKGWCKSKCYLPNEREVLAITL
jgi:hypothetical protein